jgi:hypothetical protein
MARTVDEVDRFLVDIARRAKPFAKLDWETLQQFARTEFNLGTTKEDPIQPWDIAFLSEKLKQARYAFSENELKQYFPLPKVLDGLFGLRFSLSRSAIPMAKWSLIFTSIPMLGQVNAVARGWMMRAVDAFCPVAKYRCPLLT